MKMSVYLTLLQCIVFIVTHSEACNYSIDATDVETNLTSPGYPLAYGNYINCWWRIKASSDDKLVGVNIVDFHLETSAGCVFDSLSIYDGMDSSSPLLSKGCGNGMEPVVTSGRYMYLHFVTDQSNTFREQGFQLQIFQVQKCGGEITATSETRYITSPGYPYTYFNSMSCTWRIKADKDSDTILVRGNDVNLQAKSSGLPCTRDVLTFYNGHAIGQQDIGLLGRFCGRVYPTVQSPKNVMTVDFRTDSTVTAAGFNLSYTAKQGGDCNITMVANSLSTVIYSPGYPDAYYNNLNCFISIVSITNNIRLDVTSLDIEGPYPQCDSDSLTVYRGFNEDAKLRTLCGDTANGTVIYSRSTFMSLRFTTDNDAVGRGYRLQVTNVGSSGHVYPVVGTVRPFCGNTYLSATSVPQYLQSPGYPTKYYNNENCRWTITASHTDMYVRIVVIDASFENSGNPSCPYGYVEVYDGTSTWGTPRRKWCSVPRKDIQSSGNTMTLRFHTDVSNYWNNRGFKLKYFETDEPRCGGTINASRITQSLTSPNYPQNYDSNMDCTWRVYAPSNTNIQLTMPHLEIEGSIPCSYDFVTIYDGTRLEPSDIGKLCGSTATDYISSENSMTIKFHSDSSTQRRGFDFRITAGDYQACILRPIQLSANSYTDHDFRSPNYPFSYPNNAECTWLIDTGDRDYIVQINILEMSLEYADGCSLDYVEAFDGEDDSASSLGRWCGHDVPIKSSTGQYMFLKFKSDSSNHQGSFKIQYSHEFQLYHPDVNTGAIVGGIIGAIAFIVIVIIIVGKISSRRQKTVVTRVPDTRSPPNYMYTVSQGTLEATLTPSTFSPPPATFSPPPSYDVVMAGTGAPGGPPSYPGVPPSVPPNK